MLNIYGKYAPMLDNLLNKMLDRFEQLNKDYETTAWSREK